MKVSVVNLDFGLIQFGRSASLKFDIVNESHCPVSFTLEQLVKEKKIFMVSLYSVTYAVRCVHMERSMSTN